MLVVVLGIEKCTRRFNAVKRGLPVFKPKPDLSMVLHLSMINFGFEWSVRLGPTATTSPKVPSNTLCATANGPGSVSNALSVPNCVAVVVSPLRPRGASLV